jgi:SSS family solute:Na+ symporter
MDTLLFLILFTLFGALYLILGLRASKNVTSATDYFVANRQLGVWQITCNLIATQLGGGMLLGTAASAYATGLYGILYTLGMALGFIILGCGAAARLQQFKVTTTAELFETRYHSPLLKKIASLLSIATLFGILVAQVVGFKSLLASIGLGAWYISIPFWLSVVMYTMIGGLRSITINDMVQLCIITSTFVGIFFYILMQPDALSLLNLATVQGQFATETFSFTSIFGIICMPALFALIEQDLAQRFFASKSALVATASACYAATFILLFSIIPVYLGMQAKLSGLSIPDGASPLLVILESMVPPFFFALALCAIIAAIVSTADALMNGISANITLDFNLSRYIPVNTLKLSKIITLVVGLLSLGASYYVSQNVITLLINSYEISVSCLLVPLLFCYFKHTVSRPAAYASIVGGFAGFLLGRIFILPIPKELFALIISLISYVVTEKVTKNTRKKILASCILIFSTCFQITHANSTFYSLAHGYFTLTRHVNTFISPVLSTGSQIHYAYQMGRMVDVPPIVINFCRAKLQEHGLNPGDVKIKIKEDCGFIETFAKYCIAFAPKAAEEFKDALENPDDAANKNIIKVYSTFIDHEIAHLKGNDTVKRVAFLAVASLLSYGSTSYLIKSSPISFAFQKPTQIKEFFIALGAYSVLNITNAAALKFIYARYAQYQENNADAYAIACATDPEALRYAARCIELSDNAILDFLCGNDQIITAIPTINQWHMKVVRDYLVEAHKEEKSPEEFREWLKKQTNTLIYLKYVCDPEHPSGIVRGQRMRAAADALS